MTDTAMLFEALEKRWESLTIANDFVFSKAMLNPELCREVLEAVLGQPIARIEYINRQETFDTTPENKSIRLDVYVRDDSGRSFNVEMQTVDTHELPRRSRYYQSLISLDQIAKGQPYSQLKDSIVIFLCCFDLFDLGQRVYSFRNRCDNNPELALGDGSRTIFLSATSPHGGDGTSRIDELLDYVADGTVSGELSARLAKEVSLVLDNRKWRLEFMMLEVRDQLNYEKGEKVGLELGRAEGEKVGLERGRAEGEAAGLERGRAEGEATGMDRYAKLVDVLLAQHRSDELAAVGTDKVLLEQLLKEFGI